MKISFLALFFSLLVSGSVYSKTIQKKCESLSYEDCLHSQGLYTDEELENANIDEVEQLIIADKNSQINKPAKNLLSDLSEKK